MSDLSQELFERVAEGAASAVAVNPRFVRELADRLVLDEQLCIRVVALIKPELLAEALALSIMRLNDQANSYNRSAIATYKTLNKQAVELAAEKLSAKMYEDLSAT